MAGLKVSLRGGFSDRNGIKSENTTIQTHNLDERTRISLVNATSRILNSTYELEYYSEAQTQQFIKNFWSNVYGQEVEWGTLYKPKYLLEAISDTIKTDTYDAVLTILEYIVKDIDESANQGFWCGNKHYAAADIYNTYFQKEYVGYRFINGEVRPITNEVEVETIEDAMTNRHKDVTQHIDKALGFLSDRESPDYANSIKESISAVERMCSIILGNATTLGDALKHLENSGVNIHPALKGAFGKLYGYTSDASGIRHAGELGGADSTFEEAKFMLVSCCAFINYLTGVMAKRP